jgi:multiple sugar transport system substrate-binding protein
MPRLRSLVGLVAVAAVLVVAGCSGSSPGGGGGGGGGGASGTGPISFAIGKDTSGFFTLLTNEWNQQNPNQKVNLIQLPEAADQQRQAFVTTLQAHSSAYDVLGLDVVWPAEFAKEGWTVPLNQSDFPQDKYLPGAYQSAFFDGKLWAAPFRTNGGLLFYRKDLLDKEHMQPPTTWEQVESEAKTLSAKYHIGGFGGQYAKYEGLTVNFAELVWSAGGDLVDSSGKPTVNTPQANQALNFLASGFQQGWIPKEAITYMEEPVRRAFEQGHLAFMRQWPYAYSIFKGDPKIASKFDVEPLPGFANGKPATAVGGYDLAISAYSKKQATALAFIKFATNEQNERTQLVKTSELPVLKSLYDDTSLQQQVPYLKDMKQDLLNSHSRPATPFYNDVSLAIQSDAYAALQGQKPVDKALSSMQSAMQKAMTQ